jgi:short-subunit dehydrogenase
MKRVFVMFPRCQFCSEIIPRASQGSAYISTYAVTKAFNIVLAEGLWEKWRAKRVDVLARVSGTIKTPDYMASEPEQTCGLADLTMGPGQGAGCTRERT